MSAERCALVACGAPAAGPFYLFVDGVSSRLFCAAHLAEYKTMAQRFGGEPVWHFSTMSGLIHDRKRWKRLPKPLPLLFEPDETPVIASGRAELVPILSGQPSGQVSVAATCRKIVAIRTDLSVLLRWEDITTYDVGGGYQPGPDRLDIQFGPASGSYMLAVKSRNVQEWLDAFHERASAA